MDKPAYRDWIPVAPVWEQKPDDTELWRRVTTLPGLAFNRAELELFNSPGGRETGVLGVGSGFAPLALAALGARVTVVDPSHSLLDLLLVRCQLTGLAINSIVAELDNLAEVPDARFDLCYAAQFGLGVSDLGRFYSSVYRLTRPGGRLVVSEYHPVRRIWRPEPGSPRLRHSYFERRRECIEGTPASPADPCPGLGKYEHHWPVSDHVHFLLKAGFRLAALEEVGEVKQQWEVPNLRGLPEQLVLAADKPGE